MSEPPTPIGAVAWTDLTVPDADRVRDFYAAVAGWTFMGIDMGGYQDYVMQGPDGAPVAGVCHARGVNEGLPPQWILYVTVTDLDGRLERCRALGGSVLVGPKAMGKGRYAVIRDPAGAVFALVEQEAA
jgi:predicted enzyme related to lactoylglutathione lyase